MEYSYVKIIKVSNDLSWVEKCNAIGRVCMISQEQFKYARGMAHKIVSSENFGSGLSPDMFIESTEEEFDKQTQMPLRETTIRTINIHKECADFKPNEPLDSHKRII